VLHDSEERTPSSFLFIKQVEAKGILACNWSCACGSDRGNQKHSKSFPIYYVYASFVPAARSFAVHIASFLVHAIMMLGYIFTSE
jgi:hypothetical protein